jgi:hypothetical protein
MSVRKVGVGVVLAVACAAMLVAPVTAGAQTTHATAAPAAAIPTTSLSHIPVSGKAANGKAFTGHYNVSQFVTRAGKTYAIGTLAGHVGHRTVKRSNVAIPVSMGAPTAGGIGQVASPAAACPILNLVLGPLHLNLLGLNVDLNQVVLNITAQSGAGNLLGNLLCSVAGLLNQPALPTQQLTGLLNILQQILNVPALANL